MATLCVRCRRSIFGPRGTGLWAKFEARNFGSEAVGSHAQRAPRIWSEGGHSPRTSKHAKSGPRGKAPRIGAMHPPMHHAPFPKAKHLPPPVIKDGEGAQYFEDHVKDWVSDLSMQARLVAFGIPQNDVLPLLKAFEAAVKSRSLSTAYGVYRFDEPLHDRMSVSVLYSNIFFLWSTDPSNKSLLLSHGIPLSTLKHMSRLVQATDRLFLAEDFAPARKMSRKVIMHVGPTNSGKTYHALRALAAAPTGVYAGPLRLLAHEIWERLNLGQIAPAGSEDPTFVGTDLTDTVDTLPHADAIKKHGNPKYARLCNMLTGEEQKMVSASSPLLSCTVEMLSYSGFFDVAVVDEIQMISDPQRGSGWTNAVLGLPARELHLCGEETAVPIVEELLKNTGDELVVRRYERLTPLSVEKESLKGDWKKIQKGDCIVAFSRSEIFGIKRRVEEMTGLRCAVIYGRLPPEIRSEQAAMFNDPNSGYDVLVGSDAIGMGLNLKIRRLVFHTVEKHRGDGGTEKLSVSQVKQIAGRAGRYGLNGASEPGGFTTTLEEKDLAYLRECLATPFSTLPFARITFDRTTFTKLLSTLPTHASTSTIIQAHHYISALPPKVRYQDSDLATLPLYDFVDENAGEVTVAERIMHILAPVTWRDPYVVSVMKTFLAQARGTGYVDLVKSLEDTTFLQALETVESFKARGGRVGEREAKRVYTLLSPMESFHKALVLYIWLSFRSPIMYPDYKVAAGLKERLEAALQWALEGVSASMLGSRSVAGKKDGVTKQLKEEEGGRGKEQWQHRHGHHHHSVQTGKDSSRPVIPSLSKSALRIALDEKKQREAEAEYAELALRSQVRAAAN